jgi:FK506-binding protein 4/5
LLKSNLMLVDLYDTGLDEFIFNLVTQDKESRDLNNEEKIEVAGKEKQEWNALFKLDKYARASKRYEKVLHLSFCSNP